MDPWGTPLYISRKELQTDPILTHCFYADDNTLSYGSNSVDDAIETLEEQSDILIKWFTENHMLINFRPFQLVGKHMRKI
jgi:hypothetical protein